MKRKILIHTCCGPCTIYPLQRLRAQNWAVHGFFYNPNIQPYQELQRRLEALQVVAQKEDLKLIIRPDYELEAFVRQTAYRESQRCIYCYSVRLEAAARLAKKSRFDAFTTTLLYSKRQKHELIRTIAEEAARRSGIQFHYQDFREGWKEGQGKAKDLGIYRQQYCGCIYSEKERFCKD
ncbi:MAG: epoxyqueuosine reductase QueH [Desulfoferrobacter sp.]